MDDPHLSAEELTKVYRDLDKIHRWLGHEQILIRALAKRPPASLLDIGCGEGKVASRIQRRFGIPVTGIELRRPLRPPPNIEVIEADATRDKLPEADVAISSLVLHHLTDQQVIALMRNLSNSVRRFIALDLVRHPLPLFLYSAAICPLIGRIAAQDGKLSIRRAFTKPELERLVRGSLGERSSFSIHQSPWLAWQLLDVEF